MGTGGYLRTTGDFNVRTGEDSAFRLNAIWTKANNGGAKVDKYGIAPCYGWGIGTRDEFTAGLFHLNVDNVPLASVRDLDNGTSRNGVAQRTIANIKPGNFYGIDNDYLTGKASYGTLAHLHRFDDGGELRSQVRSGTFDRAQWSTAAGFCAVAPNLMASSRFGAAGACPTGTPAVTAATLTALTYVLRSGLAPRKDQYNGTYLQSDYGNHYPWGGMRHELLAGIDASRESADRYGAWGAVGTNIVKGPTFAGTPDDGRTLAASPTYRPTNRHSSTSFGAYVQDLVQVAPDWKLLAGCAMRISAATSARTFLPMPTHWGRAAHRTLTCRAACSATAPASCTSRRRRSPITCHTGHRSISRPTPTSM